jgi:hypothetical protein
MDTERLRVLRTAPELQALLRSLLLEQRLVPAGSQLLDLASLSPQLQQALERAERDGRVWCAWVQNGELSAVSAHIEEHQSRAHGRPVLLVFLHDQSGRVIGSTAWLEAKPGSWAHSPGA